jgi:DNA-binding GntR family transcriptional regulator
MPWDIQRDEGNGGDRLIPFYLRIRDHFAASIEKGALPAGRKLPSERELRDRFQTTRVTVRQALMQLEAEGLIYRENRRGWFVSPPRILYDPTADISFTESVIAQGRTPGCTVLSGERFSASPWESRHMGVEVGDPIYLIRRLRSVDGRDVLLEHLHIDAQRCPGLLELPLDRSLTELMAEHYGILEHRPYINMRPTALSVSQAEALGVAAGTPSLYLSRTILDQFDRVVELDQEFWRHDAIDICVSAGGRSVEQAIAMRHRGGSS